MRAQYVTLHSIAGEPATAPLNDEVAAAFALDDYAQPLAQSQETSAEASKTQSVQTETLVRRVIPATQDQVTPITPPQQTDAPDANGAADGRLLEPPTFGPRDVVKLLPVAILIELVGLSKRLSRIDDLGVVVDVAVADIEVEI